MCSFSFNFVSYRFLMLYIRYTLDINPLQYIFNTPLYIESHYIYIPEYTTIYFGGAFYISSTSLIGWSRTVQSNLSHITWQHDWFNWMPPHSKASEQYQYTNTEEIQQNIFALWVLCSIYVEWKCVSVCRILL